MTPISTEHLLGMNLSLRHLEPGKVQHELTPEEFRHIFQACDALWIHSGDPKAPHAELTSGKCSNGFVDVLRVLRYSNLCRIMAGQLVRRLHATYRGPVDWVAGSDHAGATLSFAVAEELGAQHDFTEKGPNGTQLWKRFEINPKETVLQVEELVTTTKTLQAVRTGIQAGNPTPVRFAPVVLTLVHRSDAHTFGDGPIVYAVHYNIQTWEPADCPLCQAGSKRLRPKQRWAELTGQT